MSTSEIDHAIGALQVLRAATIKSQRVTKDRANLPPGSGKTRVNTANARWSIAAEARDCAFEDAREAVREAGLS